MPEPELPQDIIEAEVHCKRMEAAWRTSKEDTKAAKEAYDLAVARLRQLVTELSEPSLFKTGDGEEA